jgi:hypothetical protein
MSEGGGWQAKASLQVNLPGSRVKQVRPAHDLCDSLVGIVDHDGQLVGGQPIGSLDHEITDRAFELGFYGSLYEIGESDAGPVHPQPYCAGLFPHSQSAATGTGVNS